MDSQTLFSAKDKIMVVTGGIGLMISQVYVNNGSRVYIVARKQSILEKAALSCCDANWGSKSIESYPDKTWEMLLTLYTQRVFILTQQLLPQLKKRASKEAPA
ncbi:hypothetical protein GGH96_000305 [Coemansia sp. RSA 1972]|nr:hypothetical protein GGH96_000305 [Coemansia sp. RSA 1972]